MGSIRKKCLVIGFGSIGARHARILKSMGCAVSVVSKRPVNDFDSFPDIRTALHSDEFEYAVICRPTAEHYQAAWTLKKNGFDNVILIEKPLFEKAGYPLLTPVSLFVGYNLRFHPVIRKMKKLIRGRTMYSMHVYCGQYLPQWRSKRDYRTCYSAFMQAGGGVLRDLSHELDYICYLTGPWEKVAASGARVSKLEIDCEDLFGLLIQTQKCPLISLQINYLDLTVKRQIILNGEGLSISADLVAATLEVNGETMTFGMTKDQTYTDQHRDILSGNSEIACTYQQGLDTMSLIEAAQKASREEIWIKRN